MKNLMLVFILLFLVGCTGHKPLTTNPIKKLEITRPKGTDSISIIFNGRTIRITRHDCNVRVGLIPCWVNDTECEICKPGILYIKKK